MSDTAAAKPEPTEQELKEMERKYIESRDKLEKTFKKYDSSFKWVATLFILSGFGICFYNIPAFRAYAATLGAFVVPLHTFYWVLIGFGVNHLTRKAFYRLTSGYFKRHLHPKIQYYQEIDQKEKLTTMVKQTYEGFFHLIVTAINFYLFRGEIWFPSWIGGAGECGRIFETYPTWPEPNGYYLLAFYQFQLGTYVWHILDLLFFDHQRFKKQNYGELFYHHFVAILLIGFSLVYNFVPIGMTVLFVHDASDCLRGFSRLVGDSEACIRMPWLAVAMNVLNLAIFAYMRLAVLPFCLIESMQANNPSSHFPEWEFLWVQCAYFIVISCAIYCIQCYWGYFMFYRVKEEHDKNKPFVERFKKTNTMYLSEEEINKFHESMKNANNNKNKNSNKEETEKKVN